MLVAPPDAHVRGCVQSGHAYHCFCSSERLDELRASQKRRGLMPMYDRACLSLTPEEVQARHDAGESFTIRFKVRCELPCVVSLRAPLR